MNDLVALVLSPSFVLGIVVIVLLVVFLTQNVRYYKRTRDIIAENEIKDEQERNKALIVSRQLNKIILESLDFEDVVQKIADTIPNELYFGTGVVAIIDEEKQTIKRVAASRTKEAEEAIRALKVPFKQIEISLADPNNLMAKAVATHRILITGDAYDVLGPVLSHEEAQTIQRIMGTKTTFVCPIYGSKDRPIGVFVASTKKFPDQLTQYEKDMIQIFIDGVGIAIEHALLYSRLRETTAELAEANVKLKQLDRLKDDFVSVASHELRTPMTAIKSYLWMALNKRKAELSSDLERYLNKAYISVDRLINLVNDMLNVSRIEGGRIALRLAETDIVSLAKEVIDEVAPKAYEKGVTLHLDEGNIPRVLCDKDKIHEVYLNLIGNSIKFTPSGGLVTVSFAKEDPFVKISIKDTGHGIAKDDINRLFTKFGRLDNSYVMTSESTGTGLGLFISKALVTLHKGVIACTSEGVGKGSTFFFTLPITGSSMAHNLKQETTVEVANAKELEKTSVVL